MKFIHIYPTDDIRDHIIHNWPKLGCWCDPEVIEYQVVHRSMDLREEYESGEVYLK